MILKKVLKNAMVTVVCAAMLLTFMPGVGMLSADEAHAAITKEGTVGRHLKFEDGVCTALDGEPVYQYSFYETYVDKEGNLLNMEIKPVHWELDDTGTMTIGDGSDGQVIFDGWWPHNADWTYTFDLDSIKKIQFNGNVNVSNSCELFNSLNGLQEFDASGLRLGDPIAYRQDSGEAVYGLNVDHLFYNCPELKNLDLRGTGFCENMHSSSYGDGAMTFYGCTKLESLQFDFNDEIAKKNSETFYAGRITVSGAFQKCPNLKSADATYLIGYIAKKFKEGDAFTHQIYGDYDGGLAYAPPTVDTYYNPHTISENVVYGLYDEYPEFYRTRMEDKVNALKDAIESIGTSDDPRGATFSTAEAFTAYENAVENFITMETYNEVLAMKDEAAALLAQDPFPYSDAVKTELQNIVSMTDALGGLSTKQDAQNIINRYNNYNQMVAGAVKELFDALPAKDDVKLSHEEHISAVRIVYEDLTDNQKALISTDELQKLVDAETGLSELKILVSDLQDLVDETKVLKTDIYTDSSVEALTHAINNAEALFPPTGDPTKGEVDAARIALEDAIRNLKTKEAQDLEDAKKSLEDSIKDAEDKLKDKDKYTDDTVKDLEDALNKAKETANNPDATKEDLEKAKKDLDDAIKNLKEKDSGGNSNNDPSKDPNKMGEDGTALGKGASAAAADKAITNIPNDKDPAGSKIMPLKLKSKKQTKSSAKISWSGAVGAAKYVVYGNECGDAKKMQKLTTVTGKSFNVKKLANGKKLRKGKYHKFIVVALDSKDMVVSTSKVVHVVTKGGKNGNHKSVKVSNAKKFKKGLKQGKSLKIKGKAIGKKVKKHVKLRYESSNPAVATVSASGKVKAVGKGSATIIVYAQNGVSKNVKVKVK